MTPPFAAFPSSGPLWRSARPPARRRQSAFGSLLIRQALHALLLCPLFTCLVPRAWDSGPMLEAAQRLGPRATSGAGALQAALAAAAVLDETARLRAVNDFFNHRILFRIDIEVWGVEDYWASPLELLAKGEGDCEDFAIAKYFSLLALGMPSADLRLVYVRARMAGSPDRPQAHMVLAHYTAPGAAPTILDNLVPEVLPAGQRSDLTPVFSFNSDGLWQGIGTQSAGDPLARLSRWREVLAKARAEGFL